jgi:hypothetical protein
MRVERVRLARDPVESEIDADACPGGAHALVDVCGTVCATEFFREIGAPVDALRRQVGIQLERMPAHERPDARLVRGKLRERHSKPTPPDEAPRADDVRDHVDRQRAFGNVNTHWVASTTRVGTAGIATLVSAFA